MKSYLIALRIVVTATLVCCVARVPCAAEMPLIPDYPDLRTEFDKKREALGEGEYGEAIAWFQAKVDQPGEDTYRLEPGYYVSIRHAALEVLAELPAEGKQVYRRLFEPKAAGLFSQAAKEYDTATLRDVLARYPLTDSGQQAAVLLGSLAMDKGRFDEAVWWWQRAVELAAGSDSEGPLVARIALAARLSGQPAVASSAARRVNREFSEVSARWGRKTGRLPELIEKYSAPSLQPVKGTTKGWPTANGGPAGWARTPGLEQARLGDLRWCWPEQLAGVNSRTDIFEYMAGRTPINRTYPHPSFSKWKVQLNTGLVQGIYNWNSKQKVVDIPPVIRPIVRNGRVIVRDDDGLFVLSLGDGKTLFSADIPLQRKMGGDRYGMTRLADEGWYKIGSDGKRVFVMGEMLPTVATKTPRPGQTRKFKPEETDTSALFCVSLENGRILWRIGYGAEHSPDSLKMVKFHTAPLVAGERLYSLLLHRGTGLFRLVCLDPISGKQIWNRQFCHTSKGSGGTGQNLHAFVSGTAPSAFADRIVACTNAGVIGAFDAETGIPIWLRQYDTPMAKDGRRGWGAKKHRRVNPLLLAGGAVVALPYDSDHVLAYDLHSGKSLWRVERKQAHRLTGLGNDRLLLTGDSGWRILRISDGTVIFSETSTPVYGKPAVTDRAVWLSAKDGRVLRLEIDSGEVSTVGRIGRGLLGNLLVVNGRLIAANAAGVCAYDLRDTGEHSGTTDTQDGPAGKQQ